MRQWIREHPWRLEVVPFLVYVANVSVPLIFLSNIELPEGFWENYLPFVGVTLFIWVASAIDNHRWVHNEPQKRFNYKAEFTVFMLLCFGFGMLRHLAPFMVLAAWCVFGLMCLVVQARIEQKRPFIPYNRPHTTRIVSGVTDIFPVESFYYREDIRDRWKAVRVIVAAIFTICIVVLAVKPDSETWFFICLYLMLIYLLLFSRNTFVITNERVYAQTGVSKVTIDMDDIEDCEVIDYEPVGWVRQFIPYDKPGRYLWLKTKEMPFYLLGLENPDTGCKLVRLALAGRNIEE